MSNNKHLYNFMTFIKACSKEKRYVLKANFVTNYGYNPSVQLFLNELITQIFLVFPGRS